MPVLPALRLVEMQLNRPGPATPPEDWDPPGPPSMREPSPAARAVDARCCQACGGKRAHFGFGPPLTPKRQEQWACFAHRAEVEQALNGARNRGGPGAPRSLS